MWTFVPFPRCNGGISFPNSILNRTACPYVNPSLPKIGESASLSRRSVITKGQLISSAVVKIDRILNEEDSAAVREINKQEDRGRRHFTKLTFESFGNIFAEEL